MLPLSTIASLRTSFNPFSHLSRPCRLLVNLMQTPKTVSPALPSYINIEVTHLPANSKKLPELTVAFKTGQEVKLEVGKFGLGIKDVVEEIGRIGRKIQRDESLKG